MYVYLNFVLKVHVKSSWPVKLMKLLSTVTLPQVSHRSMKRKQCLNKTLLYSLNHSREMEIAEIFH